MADRVGKRARIRYVLLGLVVGGIWLLNSDQPLWLHALRMLAILLVVPAVAGRLLAAAARRRGQEMAETISIGRLVAIKFGLVIVALVVTGLLGDRVADLDLYVAASLALTLALGGPAIHHRLLVKTAATPHANARAVPARRQR
jgi:hypothetical protein